MCCVLNGLCQPKLSCYPVNLAVCLLQRLVRVVSCLQSGQIAGSCITALLGAGSDDSGTNATL